MRQDHKSNCKTLEAYELGVQEYISGTLAEVNDTIKIWIDKTLHLLTKDAHIIEIGSAFGRDASYIESKGFIVQRTDATRGFVQLLHQKGYSAQLFNILEEEFQACYDLIFASAVFLHFTPSELQAVLDKIRASLSMHGILSFSLKQGEGEEWTSAKVGRPRYFCYWRAQSIQSVLTAKGFEVIDLSEDDKFLRIIAKKAM